MESPYRIQTKPGGHGAVHLLLYSSGTSSKWEKEGIEWIVFLQDTNGVMFRGLPAVAGVSLKHKFVMNSVAIERKPEMAVGVIAQLNKEKTNESLTINVEYNQIESIIKGINGKGKKKGEASSFPGNANTLLFKLDVYNQTLEKSKGIIPEFVNPKYTDKSRQILRSSTRLENMMQEFPKLLLGNTKLSEKVGLTQLPRFLALYCVKHNLEMARIKHARVGHSMSAPSAEAGFYFMNRQLLRAAAVNVNSQSIKGRTTLGGMSCKCGARVVLQPSFGITVEEIQSKITGKVDISDASTLIIDGENIELGDLELDGTLIIRASGKGTKITIKKLKVKNEGWDFKEIDSKDEEIDPIYRVRGYILEKKEEKVIEFDDGKQHIIDGWDYLATPCDLVKYELIIL